MASYGDSGINLSGLSYIYQHKAFYANGRYWVFGCDGTNFCWTTSTDGSSWASLQTARASTTANNQIAVYHDGTYVHYVYVNSGSLYYRRGTTDSSGNISWSASEDTESLTMGAYRPSLIVDTHGYSYVGYCNSSNYPAVIKNSATDGTWTTEASWPVQLSTTLTAAADMRVALCLISGEPYAAYGKNYSLTYGKLYSGSGTTWGSEESVTASPHSLDYGYTFMLTNSTDSGKAYCFFEDYTAYNYLVCERATDGTWTHTDLGASDDDYTAYSMGICAMDNDDLYVWVVNEPTAAYVNMRKRVSGTWDGSWTTPVAVTNQRMDGNAQSIVNEVSGKIGFFWLEGTTSPYDMHYYLDSITSYNSWAPTSGNNASTDANWSLGHAPQASEEIRFTSGSTANCTWNVTTSIGALTIESGYSGTITQSADFTCTAYSQADGTWTQGAYMLTVSSFTVTGGTFTGTGNSADYITCSGDCTQSGGTLTAYYFDIKMTGSSKTIDLATTSTIGYLEVSGTISLNSSVGYIKTEYFKNTGTLTIATGKYFKHHWYNATGYDNSGTIAGSGTGYFWIDFANSNKTSWSPGTISCPLTMSLNSGTSQSVSVTLSDNASFGSTVDISSSHASYTLTLTHGSNYTLTATGLTTVGNRAILTQGTGTWTFTGGYTQSGASSQFNQGAGSVVSGALTQSDGTITLANSQTWTINGGNLSHSAGTFTSSGAGEGTLVLNFTDTDRAPTFGTLTNINVTITADAAATANRICTLPSNTTFPAALNVNSSHATYTCTLDDGTNYTLSVTGLTTLGTRGKMLQGTGTWTFTGGYTQNGTSCIFTQAGNVVSGEVSISAGTLTGSTSYTWSCSDDFVQSVTATIADNTLRLIMTGSGKSLSVSISTGWWFYSIQISDDTTVNSNLYTWRTTVDSGKTLTIASSKIYYSFKSSTTTWSNSGIIEGPGTLTIYCYATETITFGTINANAEVRQHASISTDKTVSLGANTVFGGTLTVQSNHASAVFTISHGSNYTLAVTGLTTLGDRGTFTQGSGTWSFNGGYTQNGTSSVFTLGGTVNCTGDFTTSAGTFTPGTYNVVLSGPNPVVTLFTGHTFYDLSLDTQGASFASTVQATDNLYFINMTPSATYKYYKGGIYQGDYVANGSGVVTIGPINYPTSTSSLTLESGDLNNVYIFYGKFS